MSNYIERLEKEFSELDEKVLKLNTFINDQESIFSTLTIHDQDLIVAQLNAMYSYSMILKIRLDGIHMK